jgi:hypothetical protein
MNILELVPRYDSRKSFYGKVRVEEDASGEVKHLISYSTHVASITRIVGSNEPLAEVYGTYSNTTLRHIKEFLKQNGFKAENSKQIMADYGIKQLAEV